MSETNTLSKTQISSNRNASIDVFRYVCAILVVAIHTKPFIDINSNLAFAFDICTRIAVPFFFCTMGYYYIGALLANKNVFFKTFKRLVTVYFIWSVFYITYNLVNYIRNGMSLVEWAKSTLLSFFILGSWEHLWFLSAAIITVLIVTAFHNINGLKVLAYLSIPLFIFGVIGDSFGKAFVNVPALYNYFTGEVFTAERRIFCTAIPMFMMGYFLQKVTNGDKYKNSGRNKYIVYIAVFGVLNAVERVVINNLGYNKEDYLSFILYPLVFVIMLYLLKDPFRKMHKVAPTLRDLSNFTYYSHPLYLLAIHVVLLALGNRITITQTPLFLITLLLTAVTGLALIKIDNKYLNLLYK